VNTSKGVADRSKVAVPRPKPKTRKQKHGPSDSWMFLRAHDSYRCIGPRKNRTSWNAVKSKRKRTNLLASRLTSVLRKERRRKRRRFEPSIRTVRRLLKTPLARFTTRKSVEGQRKRDKAGLEGPHLDRIRRWRTESSRPSETASPHRRTCRRRMVANVNTPPNDARSMMHTDELHGPDCRVVSGPSQLRNTWCGPFKLLPHFKICWQRFFRETFESRR
jgi:hypothetical protein